jgi:Acetyltransferase (GNAT) family
LSEAAVANSSVLAIEDFRRDYPGVARLINASWAENAQQPLLYTPEFLASWFDQPGLSAFLAPTLYEHAKPVAFVAGFPRQLRYRGRTLRVIVSAFLSVSSEHKKNGYGVILWSELVNRIRSAGFDGMINYCVEGEPMNAIIVGCCQRLKLPTERIFSIPYQMRLLPPKRVEPSPEEPVNDKAIQMFLEAAAPLANEVPLARVWTEPEAAWQCRRYGAVVARKISGARLGLVTGYIMEIANPQRTKCLLVEDLLWGTLNPGERNDLLRQLLDQAAAAGAQLAIAPTLNYADMAPLAAARFRSSPRLLHVYLSVFNGQPKPALVPSMYLDVF